MEVDGISLTMGGAAVTAVSGLLGAWIKAKYGKPVIPPVPPVPQPLGTNIVNDPLNVNTKKEPAYVPVAECNRRMCEHAERMTRLEDEVKKSNATVIAKLDEIDSRAEERAQATHRRLDPIIGQVVANTEAIGNIKQLALNATMGGKK